MFNAKQLTSFLYLDKISNVTKKVKEVPRYTFDQLSRTENYLGRKINPTNEGLVGVYIITSTLITALLGGMFTARNYGRDVGELVSDGILVSQIIAGYLITRHASKRRVQQETERLKRIERYG